MATPSPQLPPHSLPDDLLQQLDAANHRFSEAKKHLDQAMNSTEYRHQERINQKQLEFRTAERELEEITAKIDEALQRPKQEQ
jgi:predicted  nucleic acid-binding Zn-ribbon protein